MVWQKRGDGDTMGRVTVADELLARVGAVAARRGLRPSEVVDAALRDGLLPMEAAGKGEVRRPGLATASDEMVRLAGMDAWGAATARTWSRWFAYTRGWAVGPHQVGRVFADRKTRRARPCALAQVAKGQEVIALPYISASQERVTGGWAPEDEAEVLRRWGAG
jgi:hypothetical protein